jgi:hypothetical protein
MSFGRAPLAIIIAHARDAARAAALLAAVLPVAVVASGCGLGAGKAPSGVQLLVTRDFGSAVVRTWSAPNVSGEETVMSLLTRNAHVGTRYGGGFVQSIDGLSGGQQGGHPTDWFYYVNGVEAAKGAAATGVNPGDRVWWDRHDWSVTDDVPAVVGSFPEPFLNGLAGKRLPVRVECQASGDRACSTVAARLRAAGVPAAIGGIGSGTGALQSLRVAVAPWHAIAHDPAVSGLAQGPRVSGVYARFEAGGATLALLDASGSATQRLGAGAGLIAATRSGEEAPVWVVTGTDASGLTRAARAFDAATLRDRFAVALDSGGALALPLNGAA